MSTSLPYLEWRVEQPDYSVHNAEVEVVVGVEVGVELVKRQIWVPVSGARKRAGHYRSGQR